MRWPVKNIIFSILCLFMVSCSIKQTVNNQTLVINKTSSDKLSIEDFFRNPQQASFKVSPNGKYISFTKPYKNRMNVYIQNLDSKRLPYGEPKQVTSLTDRDIAAYFWKGNDTILYFRDFGGDENYHVLKANIQTGEQTDLTPFDGVKVSIVDDLEDVSDDEVLIEMNKRNAEVFDVYRLNIKTGQIDLVAENPGNYVGWVTDHRGEIRLAMETNGLKTAIHHRKNKTEKFKKIIEFDYTSDFEPLFFTFDNKNLYASSNLGRDKKAIVKINPQTGKEIEKIYSHREVDVSSLFYSKKRKVLTATGYITWKFEYKFFDKIAETRNKRLRKVIKNNEVYISSANKNEDLFIVAETSDKLGAQYYLYDQKSDQLTFLANAKPWLQPETMAKMQPIKYKSRDGLTIHGYLTLPNTKTQKKLPLIVNPHGGPWHRDVWGYNPEVQFLASRGYAVLQMNFRGSLGYGKKFFTSSFKKWGTKMQDDITDGVNWAIKQGYADSKKICIYGASYGGYAVLAGLTFTPDLYACGVDYVGVSNLLTFMKSIPPYWRPILEKMYAMVGHPEKETEDLKKRSPVFHVDKIKAPLLVAQGAKDPRVNINESNQIVDSLRKRGVDVEYIVKENEGHGFHNEENRFEFYRKMEAFLSTHL
ncbi:MAG: S9 family peptidase [Oligoflexia bacterium]|nr:S9 family peptidase [Oligoflexia bacterium]